MPSIKRETSLTPLINQFLDYLLVERQSSKLTLRNYRQWLLRFSAWMHQHQRSDSVKATDITQKTVHDYRLWLAKFTNQRGESLNPATQSYHVIALRSFLRWLTKNDYPVLAPEKVDLPKTEGRRLEFLTREQLERLLSQPTISTPLGLRDKAILELLFSTGLRVSELVKLDREQIDLKRQEFGVKGKGGRVRVVYLSNRASHWLERYLVTRKDKWPPLFIRLGRVKKTFSDLSEVSQDQPAQLELGHKNIATTQIYTHVTNKQLRKVHQDFHGKGD
jgi:site-specific recombinase XerD